MGKSMGTGPVVELAAMLAEGEDRRKKTNTSRIYRSGSGHKAGGAHIRSPDGQVRMGALVAVQLETDSKNRGGCHDIAVSHFVCTENAAIPEPSGCKLSHTK